MLDLEFDEEDEMLLKALESPSSSLLKRLNEENSGASPPKKIKLSDEVPLLPKGSPVQNALKRLFPGPAGLLANNSHESNQMDICSQKSSSIFLEGPWTDMSKDFRISTSDYLYDKFNIAWIKKEAAANKFVNQKAPFLAGILFSLEVSEGQAQKSVNITLKDFTGAIQGTILQTLYEEHSVSFTLGSVIVLSNFGVLSCSCDKCDNQYLTVTSKNLSAIYSNNKTIIIKKIDAKCILSEYEQKVEELEKERRKCNSSLDKSYGGCMRNKIVNNGLNSSLNSGLRRNLGKKVVETKKNDEIRDSVAACSPSTSKKLFTYMHVPNAPEIKNLEETSSTNLDKDEQDIWKDALKDVDINSLFSDDFDCD